MNGSEQRSRPSSIQMTILCKKRFTDTEEIYETVYLCRRIKFNEIKSDCLAEADGLEASGDCRRCPTIACRASAHTNAHPVLQLRIQAQQSTTLNTSSIPGSSICTYNRSYAENTTSPVPKRTQNRPWPHMS